MNRKETTDFLTNLIIRDRLSDRKYYAKEVTLDYGTSHPKRVDIMQYSPAGTTYASDIEHGYFTCYEIKSCIQDVYSGNGLNFYGEKNYIVTTMETYKKLQEDMRSEKLDNHIKDFMGISKEGTCPYFGVIVPVPISCNLREKTIEEFENPTPLDADIRWTTSIIYPQSTTWHRTRGTTELLFCMLRSKHANQTIKPIIKNCKTCKWSEELPFSDTGICMKDGCNVHYTHDYPEKKNCDSWENKD